MTASTIVQRSTVATRCHSSDCLFILLESFSNQTMMIPRKVRFVIPEQPYIGSTPSMFSIYGSNVDRDSPAALRLPLDKDPIAWWGAYVPLESWTPPKLRKSKFKGVVRLADYPYFKSKHAPS